MRVLCRSFSVGLAVVVLVLLFSFSPAWAESLDFYQLNFNLGGTIYTDTEWGAVDFTFTGQAPIMYFNLTANGSWQVQNVPVLSMAGVGAEQTMTYYFDLGVTRGTDVSSLNYGYDFTSDILVSMPSEDLIASVSERWVAWWAGFDDGNMPDLAPANPLIGGEVDSGGIQTLNGPQIGKKYCHDVSEYPNQQCGKSECAPAAVSNSLQYLIKIWHLPIDVNDVNIASMKQATNWDVNGCWIEHNENRPDGKENSWWEDKIEYIKEHDLPVTTKIVTDINEIPAEIESGQVVEIQETWQYRKDNKWKRSGHTTALVGITKLKGGKFSLDIIDDSNQADPNAGCGSRTYIYDPNKLDPNDPNSGEFDDSGYVSKFEYAIVECPNFPAGSSYQDWDFDDPCAGDTSIEPHYAHNPSGQPTCDATTSEPNGDSGYLNQHAGRRGVRALDPNDGGKLEFTVPNVDEPDKVKCITIKIIHAGDIPADCIGEPNTGITVTDGQGNGFSETITIGLEDLEGDWEETGSKWTDFSECPPEVKVTIEAADGHMLYIDDVLIETSCEEFKLSVVDDFELYLDSYALREAWDDGTVNYTGMEISLDEDTYHTDNSKSMRCDYDNRYSPYYSETDLRFSDPCDWTERGVKALTLWFYGDPCNSVEKMYVELKSANSNSYLVLYDGDFNDLLDPNWHEWNISLQDFNDGGVDLEHIKKLTIGIGNKNSPSVGGSGKVYFDDIRLYVPRCVAGCGPAADFTGDCVTNFKDLKHFSECWLDFDGQPNGIPDECEVCDIYPPEGGGEVNFKDFAILTSMWLEEKLWP